MSKKRKCKYTPEELADHEEAVKLRKMTDAQLVGAFRAAHISAHTSLENRQGKSSEGIKKLIEGLYRGDCKGVKNATAYKIAQYAEEMGLI